MAENDKRKRKHEDSGAWDVTTPEGVLDDEELMSSLEVGQAAAETNQAEWAQGRRKAAAEAAGSSDYEQNSYDSSAMYRDLTDPEPPPPLPSAKPAPVPEPEPEVDVDTGLFGGMFGRKKASPAPSPEPESRNEPEPLAPVQPRAERAVFEPGGNPGAGEQRPVAEVRSKNTRIKRVRRGGMFKKFVKIGIAAVVLVAGAGTAIYHGYHEKLPVDQQTKDTMSKSVKVTKEKLDQQLKNLEDLAERTKVKAEEGLEKAEQAMINTEEKLKEMGKGEGESK